MELDVYLSATGRRAVHSCIRAYVQVCTVILGLLKGPVSIRAPSHCSCGICVRCQGEADNALLMVAAQASRESRPTEKSPKDVAVVPVRMRVSAKQFAN